VVKNSHSRQSQNSLVLQARQATLDVEMTNILDLIEDLKQLRDRWDDILAESKLVAEGCGMGWLTRYKPYPRQRTTSR